MKIAIISDIHGNIENLNKFYEYIDKCDIDTIFNLGDFIGGENLDEIINLIRSDKRIISVKGNHEQSIIDIENEFDLNINVANMAWLKNLPKSKGIQICNKKFLIMHSTRESCKENPPFYKGVSIESYMNSFNNEYDYVCFGHSHVQMNYETFEGKYLLNPGSIGLARDIKTCFAIITLKDKEEKIELVKL